MSDFTVVGGRFNNRFKKRQQQRRDYCSNCGGPHGYRECPHPITSYGIIAFRILDSNSDFSYPDDIQDQLTSKGEVVISSKKEKTLSLQYMLIQRKHSIGCTDLLRGKFHPDKKQQLSVLFSDLTPQERQRIRYITSTPNFGHYSGSGYSGSGYSGSGYSGSGYYNSFQNLNDSFYTKTYKQRSKLSKLDIEKLLEEFPARYKTPEWGFPKGRKNRGEESDLDCAKREFMEETGFNPDHFVIKPELGVFQEVYQASNKVVYCHKYYIAQIKKDAPPPSISPSRIEQSSEVGNLSWFFYPDAMKILRHTRIAKKGELSKVNKMLTDLIKQNKLDVNF